MEAAKTPQSQYLPHPTACLVRLRPSLPACTAFAAQNPELLSDSPPRASTAGTSIAVRTDVTRLEGMLKKQKMMPILNGTLLNSSIIKVKLPSLALAICIVRAQDLQAAWRPRYCVLKGDNLWLHKLQPTSSLVTPR